MRYRRNNRFEEGVIKRYIYDSAHCRLTSPQKNILNYLIFFFHITRRGFSRNQLGSGSILTLFLSFLHVFFRSISLRLSSLMRSLIGLLYHRIFGTTIRTKFLLFTDKSLSAPSLLLFQPRDFQLPIVSLYEKNRNDAIYTLSVP